MANTTVEPTPVVESETPRSSISAGEVAQPYEMLGRALDKAGEGLEQLATPLAEQAGYKAVATDDQGNLTVSQVPIFGPAGAAYSRALKFSALAQADGQAKQADIEISKQHPNDPEAYLTAANQFRDTLVKNVTAQAGTEVGQSLARTIDQTTTFNYRRLASEQQDTIRRNFAKDTQWVIDNNQENLISLVKSGGLETPEGMKHAAAYIRNIDAALQERTNNPILAAPKSESDKVHTELGRSVDAAKFEYQINKTLQNPASPYQADIATSASKYKLDPTLLARQLYQESGFHENALSPAGAQGIAQFMPGTAARYGVDVRNPRSSIEGAAHYMSDLSAQFGGNTGLALAGYNWGEKNVANWIASGANPNSMPRETRNYVQAITGQPIEAWLAGQRPSAFAIQNLPAQYSTTGGAGRALDMIEAMRNDQSVDPVQRQLNVERGLAAVKDFHDGVVRRTNMAELGQKAADESFLNSVIADTEGKITENDIKTTPNISPQTRENALRFKKQEDMPEPLARVSATNEMEAFKRINLPADDPNRISTVDQLSAVYTNADGKGGTTRAGFDWLLKQFNDVRSPQNERLSKVQGEFLKAVEPSIDSSNPLGGLIKPAEKLKMYEFTRMVADKVNEYRQDPKKDVNDLFDPSKPDYLGKAQTISKYQIPLQAGVNQVTQQWLRGSPAQPPGGSTIPAAPPIVTPTQAAPAQPAHNPGEPPIEYLKRIGVAP